MAGPQNAAEVLLEAAAAFDKTRVSPDNSCTSWHGTPLFVHLKEIGDRGRFRDAGGAGEDSTDHGGLPFGKGSEVTGLER